MTPEAFRAWQSHLGLSGREVAARLGKTETTIVSWRKRGIPPTESLLVRMALSAIAHNLPPWREA